jgi:hypothetical protein
MSFQDESTEPRTSPWMEMLGAKLFDEFTAALADSNKDDPLVHGTPLDVIVQMEKNSRIAAVRAFRSWVAIRALRGQVELEQGVKP